MTNPAFTPTPSGRAPAPVRTVRSGGFLDNSRMLSKLSAIAASLALGTAAVMWASSAGLSTMRYHVGNLYDFMLIPIESLGQAQTAVADVRYYLQTLSQPGQTVAAQKETLEQLERREEAFAAVLKRYNTEWVTTASPEFTTTLRQLGKLDLQQEEVKILTSLEQADAQADAALKRFETQIQQGRVDAASLRQTLEGYTLVSTQLSALIRVNDEFAKLSKDDALSAFSRAQLLSWAALLLSLGVGLALTALISRSLTRRLTTLENAALKMQSGDLGVRAEVPGSDELANVAGALNTSLVQLERLNTQQQLELERNKQLQSNIGEFLNVTMDISGGDLTKRGKVSEDVLGNVVDSINVMTEELGYTLKDVKQAATSVNLGSTRMQGTTEAIARQAQSTVLEVGRVNQAVGDISERIRQTAYSAEQAAQRAGETLVAAESGSRALEATLLGMQSIRSQVQGVSERTSSLEQRSRDISSVAETLSGLASQINLLALHAALEAAGAGEAGLRFGSVAAEVRDLADSSAEAARQVSALVRGVQSEISGVSASVKAGQGEVERGLRVTQEAATQLEAITRLAQDSARLAQSISSSTREQVSGAALVQEAAGDIAGLARDSNKTVSEGQVAAEELRHLAEALEQNLARFRLPH